MATRKVSPGALELIQRSALCRGYQRQRGVERGRPDARFCCGQRPFSTPRLIRGQRDCALQERRRRGQASARPSPAGRALQFGGDILVEPGRGLGPVPGSAVGVKLRVRCLSQGAMHLVALLE